MASGIRWTGDLSAKLALLEPKAKAAMVAAAKMTEAEAESYMKSNAPWQDRTGNARAGLKAQTVVEASGTVVILLYHQVPYGPWLELKWSGRYQIINPTIEVFAPVLVERVADLLFN